MALPVGPVELHRGHLLLKARCSPHLDEEDIVLARSYLVLQEKYNTEASQRAVL